MKTNLKELIKIISVIIVLFSFMTIYIINDYQSGKKLEEIAFFDEENLPDYIEEQSETSLTTKITSKESTTTIPVKQIVWDNLTLEELTNKLDANLYDTLKGTGIYFASFTRDYGLDPYLAVSIVNLETGCKWGCSRLVKQCNNIGGLKGKPSCSGAYMKYNSLEEGIYGYLNIIYKYYWLEGLTTAELMNSKYAEDPLWAQKVNVYYETIKAT
jgi:hypothetical protein